MKKLSLFMLVFAALIAVPSLATDAKNETVEEKTAETSPGTNPMAPFGRLVGGTWHYQGMYHRFEWGIGQNTLISHSYSTTESGETLVSEGRWFWHPGEQAIKGYAVDNLGKSFMEMTTTFDEEGKLINDLEWFREGAAGIARYRGVWEFVGDDRYKWELFTETATGPQRIMGAQFDRKRDGDGD